MEETYQPQPAPADLVGVLDDPNQVTVSVEVARRLLGVGRTTAIHAYRRTGHLIDGVPVIRVGRRVVVSTSHLRAALGRPEPVRQP